MHSGFLYDLREAHEFWLPGSGSKVTAHQFLDTFTAFLHVMSLSEELAFLGMKGADTGLFHHCPACTQGEPSEKHGANGGRVVSRRLLVIDVALAMTAELEETFVGRWHRGFTMDGQMKSRVTTRLKVLPRRTYSPTLISLLMDVARRSPHGRKRTGEKRGGGKEE